MGSKVLLHWSFVRFVAQYGGSCGSAVETAGRRMAVQLEGRLRETLERLKLRDLTSAAGNSAGNSNHLEAVLQQLLSASRAQTSRLTKLEISCFGSTGAGMGMHTKTGAVEQRDQEVTSREAALDEVVAALQAMRVEFEGVIKSSRQRYLPAGKAFILSSTHVSFSSCSWAIKQPTFSRCFLFLFSPSTLTH